jgi:hypothetical protein
MRRSLSSIKIINFIMIMLNFDLFLEHVFWNFLFCKKNHIKVIFMIQNYEFFMVTSNLDCLACDLWEFLFCTNNAKKAIRHSNF